ncbi:SufE family protein [Leptospira levettii]|uniref:SufE family protein n=1 Tax=Leptospira levettii TaxID=2023178 RepID=A0A2N0AU42_9LEPT|nr:SufE family protein [Leptospira levettii]PKA28418.1 Fe-S metabolism protein SufE [Leptospira sp. mixed culture ATI2-C-A1]MCG6147769.1 SufE family protein [Leptospira levettii]MCW7464949.1 SufE family protein [Leptospira levettii]MCW7507825.1 SufE family protein [Leptospira levettii]MCW7510867.1 SufE family protein [Leptospira levettii]
MKQNIEEIQKEIISEFSELTDWEEKFQYLIELGEELPKFPDEKRTEEYLVPGCQSRVWVAPRLTDGKLEFDADSDTALTKGLIAILIRVFSGQSPEDIAKASLGFIEEVGLAKFLSISRRNGLFSMVQKLKGYAEKA